MKTINPQFINTPVFGEITVFRNSVDGFLWYKKSNNELVLLSNTQDDVFKTQEDSRVTRRVINITDLLIDIIPSSDNIVTLYIHEVVAPRNSGGGSSGQCGSTGANWSSRWSNWRNRRNGQHRKYWHNGCNWRNWRRCNWGNWKLRKYWYNLFDISSSSNVCLVNVICPAIQGDRNGSDVCSTFPPTPQPIVFNNAGDACILWHDGGSWWVVGNNKCIIP